MSLPFNVFLTTRKRQIIWLLYEAPTLTHEQIAERLGVSKSVIEMHFGEMYRDLRQYGITNDLSLMVELFKIGWFIEENRPGYKPEPSALVGAVSK